LFFSAEVREPDSKRHAMRRPCRAKHYLSRRAGMPLAVELVDAHRGDMEVKTTLLALAAVTLIGTAGCKKDNEQTTADTSTVRALDTSGATVRPITDTVVKQTTTTTDTLKGAPTASSTAKTAKAKKRAY